MSEFILPKVHSHRNCTNSASLVLQGANRSTPAFVTRSTAPPDEMHGVHGHSNHLEIIFPVSKHFKTGTTFMNRRETPT